MASGIYLMNTYCTVIAQIYNFRVMNTTVMRWLYKPTLKYLWVNAGIWNVPHNLGNISTCMVNREVKANHLVIKILVSLR